MTTCNLCHKDDGEHLPWCSMHPEQRPISALDSVHRVSDRNRLAEMAGLRARIAVLESAAARAENADQAAAAAYEMASQLRRVAEDLAEQVLAEKADRDAHKESLEECERHGGSYREEIETWRNLVTSIRLLAEKAERVSGRVLRQRIDEVMAEIENEANREQ